MHQIDPIKRERATAVLVHFCHTKSRFQEKKIFWALPWENLRLLMWPKNSNSSYFGQNSEMQNCQDYTDPTVLGSDGSVFTVMLEGTHRNYVTIGLEGILAVTTMSFTLMAVCCFLLPMIFINKIVRLNYIEVKIQLFGG